MMSSSSNSIRAAAAAGRAVAMPSAAAAAAPPLLQLHRRRRAPLLAAAGAGDDAGEERAASDWTPLLAINTPPSFAPARLTPPPPQTAPKPRRLPGPGPSSHQPPQQPGQQQQQVREFSAYTSVDEWKRLDAKVNKYPCLRTFQAIGVSDPDLAFQRDIVAAVEAVAGKLHVECVSARPSSGGKYTALRVGPVRVSSADEVVEIYRRIKEAGGDRLKWYM